jgi:hypothetical protein
MARTLWRTCLSTCRVSILATIDLISIFGGNLSEISQMALDEEEF